MAYTVIGDAAKVIVKWADSKDFCQVLANGMYLRNGMLVRKVCRIGTPKTRKLLPLIFHNQWTKIIISMEMLQSYLLRHSLAFLLSFSMPNPSSYILAIISLAGTVTSEVPISYALAYNSMD